MEDIENSIQVEASTPQIKESLVSSYNLNIPTPLLIATEVISCLIFLIALVYIIRAGWKQSQPK